MKYLILMLLMSPALLFAQNIESQSEIIGDTLMTSEGYKIAKGDQVKIGSGSTPDGDFKFIRVNSASVFNSYSVIKSISNSANAFPRKNAGLKFKVVKIQAKGNKKHGYVNYLVLGGGVRYEVDIDNAIRSGEITIPEQYRTKTKSPVASNVSAADELKKFKELLDDGAINQSEYDAKKKQLLGL